MLLELDKKDTAILKGLAISAIVFHNFFHVLGPVHENEFTFDASRFPVFLQNVAHPSTTIQSLFSFFGHYGVQVFIFLSAYGLAKSHWDDTSSWLSFMWSRVKKFYPMFLAVICFWAILAGIEAGPLWVIKDAVPGLLLVLGGISNILPGVDLPIIGPWWFIPFIMQFYALWPILRALANKLGWQGLVALSVACLVLTLAVNPTLLHWDINLAETPIGRMRVLCLGIIAARYPLRINAFIAVPSLAVLILGSAYFSFAPLASIGATVFSLWIYMRTRELLRMSSALEMLGNYSLAIFLLNGIVRIFFIHAATTPLLQLALSCASAAVTLALSVLFHHLLALRSSVARVPNAGGALVLSTTEREQTGHLQ